jgi:hypothetical protein
LEQSSSFVSFFAHIFINHVSFAQIQDSTFTNGENGISAYAQSTVAISNCRFVKKGMLAATFKIYIWESVVYVVDSDSVDSFTFSYPVIEINNRSELTMERCTLKNSFSICGPGVMALGSGENEGVIGPFKLILKGDENKFINNHSVVSPAAHIQVGPGSAVSGWKSATFLAPPQIQCVVVGE